MSKLFHITCTLPNASLLINGIEFERVDKETIITSNPVEQHHADHFDAIPGYTVTEFSEEDQEAMEAARKLAEQARARALNQARRAAASKAKPAAEEPPPSTPAGAGNDADAGEGEGEGEAKGGEAETLF